MDLRSVADGTLSFFRPDRLWRKRAAEVWLVACVAAALFVFGMIASATRVSDILTMADANLAYGFARIDPPIVYQEIRGRYAYCGYDWDRLCQLRDPTSSQAPPVDRWLSLYPPSFRLSTPPSQADVVFMESQGASSLIDDPRFADAEYVLGIQDVAGHVLGSMFAGGLATAAALVLSLALGFATFGGQRSRSINPLWMWFALVASGFFAWMCVHVLAEPAGFAIVLALELALIVAIPVFALFRVRRAITRQELANAYFQSLSARAAAVRPTTQTTVGP